MISDLCITGVMPMTETTPTTREKQPRTSAPPDRLVRDGSGGKGVSDTSPCLYSNNSTETPERAKKDSKLEAVTALSEFLTPYYKRAAHTLYSNVDRLVNLAPSVGHVAFLTLTFRDNVQDHEEAYKRFRSFNSHFLAPSEEFGEWLCVKERQGRGAWHYHMIIHVKGDIQDGFDFDAYEKWLDVRKKGDRVPTGNKYLRSLWAELYRAVENYGFGWVFSLEPIKSNTEGLARYVGKYISKHLDQRTDQDKGVRLVNSSRGWTKNSPRFAWYTKNAVVWRMKVEKFAEYQGCTELYQLADKLGTDWAYKYANDIMNIEKTLEESVGLCSPEYQNSTLERSKHRKAAHLHQKQTAKDQSRFRDWEREQKYSLARTEARIEAKNAVQIALNQYRKAHEEAKKLNTEVPF